MTLLSDERFGNLWGSVRKSKLLLPDYSVRYGSLISYILSWLIRTLLYSGLGILDFDPSSLSLRKLLVGHQLEASTTWSRNISRPRDPGTKAWNYKRFSYAHYDWHVKVRGENINREIYAMTLLYFVQVLRIWCRTNLTGFANNEKAYQPVSVSYMIEQRNTGFEIFSVYNKEARQPERACP